MFRLKFKVFSLIICTCIIFVLSTDNPVTRNVLDLEYVDNGQNLTMNKFLAAFDSEYMTSNDNIEYEGIEVKDGINLRKEPPTGIPVTIIDCLKGSVMLITNVKVTPTELVKGKPISMKASGVFTAARDITNLHIEAYYNKNLIFKNDVPRVEHTNPGPYVFSYDNNVPTFTPSGYWETFVYLVGAGDENLACIEATFTTP